MFSNGNHPFFASTQFLYLKEIERSIYKDFIRKIFKGSDRIIEEESLEYIMDFSRAHTFYTQSVCNRLFASGIKKISVDYSNAEMQPVTYRTWTTFFQFRNLLTQLQWNLWQAIAREGKVYQPTSKSFIEKHKIGIPANVQRGIESLLNKEMIFRENDNTGSYYSVLWSFSCTMAGKSGLKGFCSIYIWNIDKWENQ